MAADGYVTIHRTTDAAQGELLAETLRSDGIDARFHRVSSALIGVPTSMIEMTIDVPAPSEARARELLRDLEYVGASDTAAEAGEAAGRVRRLPTPKPPRPAARAGRRAAPAARRCSRRGSRFFCPGGAHLYARRPWTALVVALGLVGCLVAVVIGHGALDLEFALAIGIALVLVRRGRRRSRGARREPGRSRRPASGSCRADSVCSGSRSRSAAARRPDQRDAAHVANATAREVQGQLHRQRDHRRESDGRAAGDRRSPTSRSARSSFAGDELYDIGIVGLRHRAPRARRTRRRQGEHRGLAGSIVRVRLRARAPEGRGRVRGRQDAPSCSSRARCRAGSRSTSSRGTRGSRRGQRRSRRPARCVPPKGTAHESAGTLAPRR